MEAMEDQRKGLWTLGKVAVSCQQIRDQSESSDPGAGKDLVKLSVGASVEALGRGELKAGSLIQSGLGLQMDEARKSLVDIYLVNFIH